VLLVYKYSHELCLTKHVNTEKKTELNEETSEAVKRINTKNAQYVQ